MRRTTPVVTFLAMLSTFSFPHTAVAVEFGVFGDFNFASEPNDMETTDLKNKQYSFSLGQLDLFTTQDVSRDSKSFIELIVEDDGSGFAVDLERLWIKYRFSDAFNIAGGRFHTPLGFWNKNFHHGTLIQDTVSRPYFLAFEDGEMGILPVHTVGLSASGHKIIGPGTVGYSIFLSNASALDSTKDENGNYSNLGIKISNAVDSGKEPAYILTLDYDYSPLGLDYGLFGMKNEYSDLNPQHYEEKLYDQLIYGSYLRLNNRRFYLLGENFYLDNVNNATDVERDAHAWYAQLAVHLTGSTTVVLRHAELHLDPEDAFFGYLLVNPNAKMLNKHDAVTLRFDVDESNAIKIEYHWDRDMNELKMQWSFLLF